MTTDTRIAAWAAATEGDKSWKHVNDVLQASDAVTAPALGPVWLAWGAILARLVNTPAPSIMHTCTFADVVSDGDPCQHVYEQEMLPADYTRPRPRQVEQLRGRPANAPVAPAAADPGDAVHRLLALTGTEAAKKYVERANRAGAVVWLASALQPERLPPLEVRPSRGFRACLRICHVHLPAEV
jgi:hypothetical protein